MIKINPDDISLLRGALLFLLAAVVVSLVVWVGSWQYRRMAGAEEDAAQRILGAAQAQLANARAQQQFFVENQSIYGALAAKGLFSEEKRLDWIESVHRLRDRHHIFNIDYELSAQHQMDSPGSDVAAFASKVDLKFALLHEQDLLDFLADFKKEAPGVFLLDSCALSRENFGANQAREPNLAANCTMQWITVKEKNS